MFFVILLRVLAVFCFLVIACWRDIVVLLCFVEMRMAILDVYVAIRLAVVESPLLSKSPS